MGGEGKANDCARLRVGDLVFVLLLFAFAVLVPVTVVKIHLLGQSGQFRLSPAVVGGALSFLIALLVTAFDFHVGIVRPWKHQKKNGSMDGYRHVSGIPLIGSVAVLVAAVLLPAGPLVGSLLLLLFLGDPGGVASAGFVFARELLWKRRDKIQAP